jgi:predicted methyltransferase
VNSEWNLSPKPALGAVPAIAALSLLVLTMLLAAPVAAQTPHTHQHRFGDAEKWAKVFDDPERDAWQKPHEVIQALALKPDAIVADIGAGTGYFTVRLAHMTPKGRVYGVDTEPAMVKHLAGRAKQAGLANVSAIQAKPGNPALPEKADLILFVDVYHHVEDRERYFRRLRSSLKSGGRVAVIDFRMDSPVGPPKRARIEPGMVKDEMKRAGYALAQEHPFLPNQYFLVFEPARS